MSSSLTRTIRVLAGSLGSSTPKRGGAITRRMAKKRCAAGIAFIEPLEDRTLMSTYYISPTGSDSHSGTSISSPWKTITKVNNSNFKPGDSILFQGGKTFSGAMNFRSSDGNSPSNPVTIGSYGSGRATISSGTITGAYVYGSSGFTFQNLIFVGQPGPIKQDGIRFEAPSGQNISGMKVTNCDISGYQYAGILVAGNGNAGVSNVNLSYNNVHDNVQTGITTTASTEYVNKNIYIGHNQIFNNYGDGKSYVTGSGLVLGNANGATVEYNNAYGNGWKGGNGGLGIWATASNHVVFQYNVSHDNRSTRGHDGGGFDFDEDTQNSIMQYNYSYNNDGNGFQLNQWGNNSKFTNNVVRYNVSQNDGRKNNYAGLEVWGRVLNSTFYSNVVYVQNTGGSPSGIKVHNATVGNLFVNNLTFANNVIVVANGRPAVTVSSGELSGAKNLAFRGNLYWGGGSQVTYSYGKNYSGLTAWQNATGQEKSNGKSVGMQANPGSQAVMNATPMSLNTALNAVDVCSKTIDVALPAGVVSGTPTGTPSNTNSGTSNTSGPSNSDSNGGSSSTTTTSNSGWTGSDIGNVGKGGSDSQSGGVYTISASGSDIWNQSDAFRYVYRSITGDGQIVARVSSITNTSSWTKAGVMIRSDKSAGSAEVSVFVTPGQGTLLQSRSANNQSSTSTHAKGSAPEWVKLVRSGSTFTGYISEDGKTWTKISSKTVGMKSTVQIGLALTSHNNGAIATAKFDNVSFGTPTATPTAMVVETAPPSSAVDTSTSGWTGSDIGSVSKSGSNSQSGGVYTVTGSGSDIWNNSDAFRYVYKTLNGDGQIIAKIDSLGSSDAWAKAGVMIRENKSAGSKEVSMLVSHAKGALMQKRSSTGQDSSSTHANASAPEWVKLVRSGNTFTGYLSEDGKNWNKVSSSNVSMASTIEIGLAVTAHHNGLLETAKFSNVSIVS